MSMARTGPYIPFLRPRFLAFGVFAIFSSPSSRHLPRLIQSSTPSTPSTLSALSAPSTPSHTGTQTAYFPGAEAKLRPSRFLGVPWSGVVNLRLQIDASVLRDPAALLPSLYPPFPSEIAGVRSRACKQSRLCVAGIEGRGCVRTQLSLSWFVVRGRPNLRMK